jgi:acetyl-CoA synthetase
MSSLLSRFVSKTDYESYEDFKENFKFVVPENFNFAFDVVDAYAAESPKKIAWFGATTIMRSRSSPSEI